MPIDLYLAPAAAGKTEFCIQLARETAVSHPANIYVCVPTSLQAGAWRARLADAGGALGVDVVTFDELVARCMQPAPRHETELRRAVRYRLLRALIDRLPLEHYAPLQAKPGFIQVVEQLVAELKSAGINPELFQNGVSALGNEPRLAELALVYEAYQEQLQQEQWADRVGLQWLAAEMLADGANPVGRDWPLVIVDGFDDFKPVQLVLLCRLAVRVGRMVITHPWREEVPLPRYRRTRQQVEAVLGVTGTLLPAASPPASALAPLARRLFADGELTPPLVPPHLTLLELPDRAAEARQALRWLKQRIVADGVSPGETAVIARDITPYRPFLEQTAAEFGLPLYLPEGVPLDQSPVVTALLELLRLFLPDPETGYPQLPRRQLIAAWRSPYFRWQLDDGEINAADADLLDAFARSRRVIGGMEQWMEAFRMHREADPDAGPDFDQEEEVGEPFPRALVAELERKLTAFYLRCQPPAENGSMRDFVRWLEELIGPDPETMDRLGRPIEAAAESLQIVTQVRQHQPTAEADLAALRSFKEILKGMVWAEGAVSPTEKHSYQFFFQELVGAVSGAVVEMPAPRQAITAAGVIEAGGLRFAAVALLGLSEGDFPLTITEDPFLRDQDRSELRDRFDFPLRPSTQSSERAYFYEAVTRADRWLCVTRPVLADNGADWVASPFWEALAALCPQQESYRAAPLALADTASPEEWWAHVALQPEMSAELTAAATAVWSRINHGAAVWRARQGWRASFWDGDLTELAPELARRFDGRHIWSASRLEAYQTCGFFFFVQNVLSLEPRPEPAAGLDARQLGSVYHEILEKMAAAIGPEQASEAEVLAFMQRAAAPILDRAPVEQGFRETPWWSQTRQEILENAARTIWQLMQGEFQFFQAEASFGINDPPLEIPLGEDTLRLRGFIDRVDRRADGAVRIIDYKSSSKYPYSKKAFAEGKKLQLPLYALAAQERLGLGSVADGFYWHFRQGEESPFQLGKVEGGPQAAMDTAVAAAREAVQGIRGGIFAPRPPAGGCPAYCPAAAFCWHYEEGFR